MPEKPLVVVAMSGGVDSSVAAGLLLQQGYRVAGMMLRLWSDDSQEQANRCCAPDAVYMARRVAAKLAIPFYVIDARQVFRDQVVAYFLQSYQSGETPNPCVLCNRAIRWGVLLHEALDLGAAYLATGHYARLQASADGPIQLLRALDSQKDQSYVLSALDQDQLRQTLLPLGTLEKSAVRQIARELDLPAAERPDSQDLCFLGNMDYRDFLVKHLPETLHPGPIVDVSGRILGEHRGLSFYTVGQRKGLGLPSNTPLYVVDKIVETNTLVVGGEGDLGRDALRAVGINWISGEAPLPGTEIQVKVRYHASDAAALIYPGEAGDARIQFAHNLRDITAGQRAVFYSGENCLGGGTIA